MTIVEGDRGVIVIDPLISTETAAAALALYRQHRGEYHHRLTWGRDKVIQFLSEQGRGGAGTCTPTCTTSRYGC